MPLSIFKVVTYLADLREVNQAIDDMGICCATDATHQELDMIAADEAEARRCFERLKKRLCGFMESHQGKRQFLYC